MPSFSQAISDVFSAIFQFFAAIFQTVVSVLQSVTSVLYRLVKDVATLPVKIIDFILRKNQDAARQLSVQMHAILTLSQKISSS